MEMLLSGLRQFSFAPLSTLQLGIAFALSAANFVLNYR